MLRVQIRRLGGAEASVASNVIAVVLVALGLACAVLLFLGMWIVLAVAFSALAVVGLVRALLQWKRTRNPSSEDHLVIEERATTLRDVDVPVPPDERR